MRKIAIENANDVKQTRKKNAALAGAHTQKKNE